MFSPDKKRTGELEKCIKKHVCGNGNLTAFNPPRVVCPLQYGGLRQDLAQSSLVSTKAKLLGGSRKSFSRTCCWWPLHVSVHHDYYYYCHVIKHVLRTSCDVLQRPPPEIFRSTVQSKQRQVRRGDQLAMNGVSKCQNHCQ